MCDLLWAAEPCPRTPRSDRSDRSDSDPRLQDDYTEVDWPRMAPDSTTVYGGGRIQWGQVNARHSCAFQGTGAEGEVESGPDGYEGKGREAPEEAEEGAHKDGEEGQVAQAPHWKWVAHRGNEL